MSWGQRIGLKKHGWSGGLLKGSCSALPCSAALCEGCRAVTMHQVEPVPQNTCRLSWFVSQNSTFKGSKEIVHFDNNNKRMEKKVSRTYWSEGHALTALPCTTALCEGCSAVTMHQLEPVPQNTCRLLWFVSNNFAFKGSIEAVHSWKNIF